MSSIVNDFAGIAAYLKDDRRWKPKKVFECDTCQDAGVIDESLGGAPRSGIVACPDCPGALVTRV